MFEPCTTAMEVGERSVNGRVAEVRSRGRVFAACIRIANVMPRAARLTLALAGPLAVTSPPLAACAADPVVVQAPDESALRPRRLFVLLAVGIEAQPRDAGATTRAWRALGDELQVRGFDLVAISAPRSRGQEATADAMTAEVERALKRVDLAGYDELVVLSSPAGTCLWSTWIHRGVLGAEFEPQRVSLHAELQPARPGRGGVRRRNRSTQGCAEETGTAGVAPRTLVLRLVGRSSRDDAPQTSVEPRHGEVHFTLDVALDERAFGRDLVLLIDEIFAARELDTPPKLDLRRVTR